MQMTLPERLNCTIGDRRVYVNEGILYVSGHIKFEELIHKVTYELKGYDTCHYCGAELTSENRSLDHLYPQRWGGLSITDNLAPSCKCCNQQKRDMTYQQYSTYRKIKCLSKRDKFYHQSEQENLRRIQQGNFVVNPEWLSWYDVKKLPQRMCFDKLNPEKVQEIAAYYNQYRQYKHPIIISANGWLFKGRYNFNHAKIAGKRWLPAILLENVVVYDKGIK